MAASDRPEERTRGYLLRRARSCTTEERTEQKEDRADDSEEDSAKDSAKDRMKSMQRTA
jgi:hypothetical protein